MNNSEELIVNIDKPTKIDFFSKEGEKNSRVMKIKLMSKGKFVKPEIDDEVIFRYRKNDGKGGLNPATIESDGTITVVLTDQALACSETVYCDLVIINNSKDEIISTSTFSFNPKAIPSPNDPLESSNEFLYLVEVSKKAEEAAKRAEDAANEIEIKKDGPLIRAETFGAVGNGITDDSVALQKALDSGLPIQLSEKSYLIRKTLVLKGTNRTLEGALAKLIYIGNGAALRITDCSNSNINIGNIISKVGDGIEFKVTSNNDFIQYINFYFKEIYAKNDCIKIDVIGGWCSEIRLYNGRFARGNNGLYIKHDFPENRINSINLYNIGIEGVTNGIVCDAVQGEIKSILSVGHRAAENFEKLLITKGKCRQIYLISSIPFQQKYLDLSPQTRSVYIKQPILDSGFIPVANSVMFDNGAYKLIEPYRDTNRVLNYSLHEGVIDIAAVTKGDSFKYIDTIFIGQKTTEIKLSKDYGSTTGINEFYVACSRDDSTPFKISDSKGNVIFTFKNIYNWKWLHFKFLYDNQWLVDIVTLSK